MTTSTDKMRAYFEAHYAAQEAERKEKVYFEESMLADAKKRPLQIVDDFISIKNGTHHSSGLAKYTEWFLKATLADIEGYLDAAEADNLRIIKLTEDERFIHQKAAESYASAVTTQAEITEARNQLANFRQKVKVTLFDGTPVSEAEEAE